MKQIIVTGGAGFIGSHACTSLIGRGYSVVCIDNLNDYYSPQRKRKNLEEIKKELGRKKEAEKKSGDSNDSGFFFYEADILDREKLEEIFMKHKIDGIIHLAARAGVRPSVENPRLYAEVNIRGTLNLLELARKFGVRRFVFGSSSSVYGLNEKIPFSEKDSVESQTSPYGASKRIGELYSHFYHKTYGLEIACLRFFTVYGPRGRPDMAPYIFTEKISGGKPIDMYGDGSTKRDYTYVSDIVSGIISALEKEKLRFEIINLGNSSPVSLKDFISVIEKTVGKKAIINKLPMQQGDVPITFADISAAKKILGYAPKVTIEEGMKLFYEWYKNAE